MPKNRCTGFIWVPGSHSPVRAVWPRQGIPGYRTTMAAALRTHSGTHHSATRSKHVVLPIRRLLTNGRGGVSREGHPPTFWREAQLLAYPYGGGGSTSGGTHPPNYQDIRENTEKNFQAPLAPRIYRDMGQRRPTIDLPLPPGGGGVPAEGGTQLFQKGTLPPPPGVG